MPSRRIRRSSSRGVSVRECYFGSLFSVLVEFFPSSLYSRFDVSRRVLAPFPMEMEMNINAKTARTHLCLDTHTHSLTHTVVYAMCPNFTHIFFSPLSLHTRPLLTQSLLPVRTFMRRASPVPTLTHTFSHRDFPHFHFKFDH